MRITVYLTSSAVVCLATLISLVSPRAVDAAEGGAGQGAALAAAGRLNVLFLMTDEHHYRALSLAGCPYIQTPNLDRIGREGAWFTNATCVTPYCSPSRASLITGLYPHTYCYDPKSKMVALYDLKSDPLEDHNLAADPAHAETVRTMHGRLLAVMRTDGDPLAAQWLATP